MHYIRKHLLNRTITSCKAYPDDIVYGKVGCSADAFEKAVTGRKVIGADQQGRITYLARCAQCATDMQVCVCRQILLHVIRSRAACSDAFRYDGLDAV